MRACLVSVKPSLLQTNILKEICSSSVTQSSIIFSHSSYYLHGNNWLHVSLIDKNYIRRRFYFLILGIANLNLTFGFFLYGLKSSLT